MQHGDELASCRPGRKRELLLDDLWGRGGQQDGNSKRHAECHAYSGSAYSAGVYQSESVTFWVAVLTTCFRSGGERNTLRKVRFVRCHAMPCKPTQRMQRRKTIPQQRSTRGAQAGRHRAHHLVNRAQARSRQSPLPAASAYE